MAKLIRSFVKGVMNKDDDERLLRPGEFRDAQNVSIGTSQQSDVGAVENTKGNINVSNVAGVSVNAVCIGATTYPEESKVYWFVVDGTDSYIFEYDEINDAVAKVLEDDRAAASQVLNFQASYLITGVNYYDGYLYWTDDYNPPRVIHVGRAKTKTLASGASWFNEDDVNVIVKAPTTIPTLTLQNSSSTLENNLEDKFLAFAYRYKYDNDGYSALSPFTSIAFMPGSFTFDYVEHINKAMVNTYNQVVVTFNTGIDRVTDIQVVFMDTSSINIYVIETINKADLGYGDLQQKTLTFDNSKIYTVLAPDQLTRLFDNVPLKAKAQEIIGRRLIYGNYVQFRDLTNNGNPINLSYLLSIASSSSASTTNPMRTFRSDRDYEIGIAYVDAYGRMSTVVTAPETQSIAGTQASSATIYVPPTNSITANDIRVTINSLAPDWAVYYRLFVKQKKVDYYNIFPMYYLPDGIFTWFRISKADIDKFSIGDYLIAKSNALGATQTNLQYKVLDIQSQGQNFLNNGESAGLYFKIGVDGGDFNDQDLTKIGAVSHGVTESYSLTGNNSKGVGYSPFKPQQLITQHYQNVEPPIAYLKGSLDDLSIEPPTSPAHMNTFSRDRRIYVEITAHNLTTGVDTFEAYDIHGANLTSGPIDITASPQVISGIGAYKIKFGSTTGHIKGDRWAINVRAAIAKGNRTVGNGTFTNIVTGYTPAPANIPLAILATPTVLGGAALAALVKSTAKGEPGGWAIIPDSNWGVNSSGAVDNTSSGLDRVIQAGATIRFAFTETNPAGAPITTTLRDYTSSRQYANIEEWFWEDSIYLQFVQFDAVGGNGGYKNVMFRRGYLWEEVVHDGHTVTKLNINNTLSETPVRMIVQGYGRPNNLNTKGTKNIITATFAIIQSENTLLFETDPMESDNDLYHEVGQTAFLVQNGRHQGNIQTQTTGGLPAIVSLNHLTDLTPVSTTYYMQDSLFNAYCFGNGLESNRIRDDFNAPTLKYSPRVSTIIEDYKQERKRDGLTYSAPYGILINGFNEFNLSVGNYKDLDISFGNIQKLYTRDTDLLVFQQDKISKVLYGKNILSDAEGGGQVASIPQVLGNQVSFPGEYGISDNPESFAQWGSQLYFTDERRGCVLTLEVQVLKEISSVGMRDYFKDLFYTTPRKFKLGAVDPYSQKYVLGSTDTTIPCDFKVELARVFYEGGETIEESASAATLNFNIYANVAWTVALVDTGDGTSWLTMGTSTGSGDGGVIGTLAANTSLGAAVRSLTIRFTACGIVTDITLTQQNIQVAIETDDIVIVNPDDAGLKNGPGFTYTTNPGSPIAMTNIISGDDTLNTYNVNINYPPTDGVPTPGDTVTLNGSTATDSGATKGFEEGLNNKMYYLVSNTKYTTTEIADLVAAATAITPVYNSGTSTYEGSFTYLRPSSEKYLYRIWDYTDNVPAGTTGTSNATEGTSHVNMDYGTSIGKASFDYNAQDVPNRFVLKYNNATILDTGYIGLNSTANYNALVAAGVSADDIKLVSPYDGTVNNGVGSKDFSKHSATITDAKLTVYAPLATEDGWSVSSDGPDLTSFSIYTTGRTTETAVCLDTADTTYYHNGADVAPEIGDVIYSDSAGVTAFNGGGLYYALGSSGASNTWVLVNTAGVVLEIGGCACGEVAIPVISTTTIPLTQRSSVNYLIEATNNPTSWAIISTCQEYELYGGANGAVFSGTNCNVAEAKVITVSGRSTTVSCFEEGTVTKLSGSSDATITLVGVCSTALLPPGTSFDAGSIIGMPVASGEYELRLTATNCFGTSAETMVTISVNPEGLFKFKMDGANPQDTTTAACALTGTYTFFFHDGAFAYPILNNVVYTESNILDELRSLEEGDVGGGSDESYVPFNGQDKWYLMDNNEIIKIARDGRVVDTYECIAGDTKTTEAGLTKTTEGASDKTLE